MKKIQFLVSFLFVLILLSCTNSNDSNRNNSKKDLNLKHIGEWTMVDASGEKGSLILRENETATFVIGNQVLGGENYVSNNTRTTMKYEIDYSKNPIWLDLVIYDDEKREKLGTMTGVLRFLTDTKIEYKMSMDTEERRFDNFDKFTNNAIVFVFDKVIND